MCERVRLYGWAVEDAAEAAGVSDRTCYRWLVRYDAGEPMTDRSSVPETQPTKTPAKIEATIERLRRLRKTSSTIAALLKLAVSTGPVRFSV
jgi:transposase